MIIYLLILRLLAISLFLYKTLKIHLLLSVAYTIQYVKELKQGVNNWKQANNIWKRGAVPICFLQVTYRKLLFVNIHSILLILCYTKFIDLCKFKFNAELSLDSMLFIL